MPFGSSDLSHLSPPDHFALGPSASYSEIFDAARQRAYTVDSAFGLQDDVRDAYSAQLKRLNDLTGQENNPHWVFALDAISAGISSLNNGPVPTDVLGKGLHDQYLNDIGKIDLNIAQAKAQDPTLKTFPEIYADALAKRKAVIASTGAVAARTQAGLPSFAAQFAGGLVGSMDFDRDPLFVASMTLPEAGGGIYRKLIYDALIGGGTMAAQDIAFAAPKAKMLGEEGPNVFNDILTGALGGIAVRGAIEGVPTAITGALDRANPARVVGRELLATVDRNSPDFNLLRLSPAELLAEVRKLPDSPSASVAEAAAINEVSTAASAPEGIPRSEVERAVSTAFSDFEAGRPMNPDSVVFPEGPTVAQQVNDFVDQRAPGLRDQITTLQASIDEAQQKLNISKAQKDAFDAGAADVNGLTFEAELQKIKDQHALAQAELDQHAAGAGDDPFVAKQQALINKATHDDIVALARSRTAVSRSLKKDIETSYRTVRTATAKVQKLKLTQAEHSAKAVEGILKGQEKARKSAPVLDAEAQVKKAQAEPLPAEKADAKVAEAKQSLQETPKDVEKTQKENLPPVLTGEEIGKLSLAKGSVEDGWRVANLDPKIIPEIMRLSYEEKTAGEVAAALKVQLEKAGKTSLYGLDPKQIVYAVRSKMRVPSMDDKVEFAKWKANYEVASNPNVTVMGKTVPLDTPVAGPDGIRSAAKVMEEITDDENMITESGRCATPEGPAK